METMAVYLYYTATIIVGSAFLLYIGYLLRRTVLAPTISVQSGPGSLAAATPAGGLVARGATALGAGGTGENFGRMGSIMIWMAAIILGSSLTMRVLAGGRAPLSNQFEFAVAFAFSVLVAFIIFDRRYDIRNFGVFVTPVALGLLLYAATIPATVDPLIPALQNNLLLTVHVSTAVFAYGMFAVAFGAALMYLIQGANQRVAWLPASEILDQVSYRAVTIGFPLLAVVLILGAIWGNTAWGRFWAWDPKETSTLATWLIYAAYMHTRAIVGWRGKRSALILMFGFGAVMFTFFGVNLFLSGLHSYSGLQ